MTQIITIEQLRELTGSEQERNQALQRALNGNRASYGWLQLEVENDLLYVESNPFATIINTNRVVQTEDGPSVQALGDRFDEIVVENINQAVHEFLWDKQ